VPSGSLNRALGQFHRSAVTTRSPPCAGVVNQNAPHRLSNYGEEVGAVGESYAAAEAEPEVGLMDKCRRRQCLRVRFAAHSVACNPPKFPIDEFKQARTDVFLPRAEQPDQLCYLTLGGVHSCHLSICVGTATDPLETKAEGVRKMRHGPSGPPGKRRLLRAKAAVFAQTGERM
jgi:hypothetical protein